MSRASALLTAVLALVLTMVIVWIVRRGEDAAVALPPVPEITRLEHERAPAATLASVDDSSGRVGASNIGSTDRPTLGIAPRAATREPSDLVRVRVVEGPASVPMADAEVSLQTPGHPTVYGVTDERGEFDFEASEVPAALGDKVSVVVKDADGHERLRDGVVLARNIVLRARSKAVLSGEIALPLGESPEWLYVSIWSQARGWRGGETFIGYQNLGTNGRFAIPALGEPPPDFVRIEVARTGLPVSLRMPTTELLVPPGPRIVVGLVLLQIAVVDELGEPVPEALVRCTATAGPDNAQPTDVLAVEPSTAVDGRARLWVPAGSLTVVAGSSGYAPARTVIRAEVSPLDVVLRLRKLGDSDRLPGSVVYEDGSAVPERLEVRGRSDDPSGDFGRIATSAARTDDVGHFVLPIATDQHVEVQAVDPVTGQPGVAKWRPGDGPVRIVIDRGQALTVRASELPTAALGSLGLIQVALVRERDQGQTLQTLAFPVSFDHVPVGRWSVYALDRIHDRWARGEVFMTSSAPEDVALDFESLHYVVGSVDPVPRPGMRLTVDFTPSGWSARAVETLLSVDVAPDGTFRVPAPGAGELVLREDSRTIARRPAVGGGAPLIFTLPD